MHELKTPEDILEDNGYSIEELEEEETILFRNPDYTHAIIGMTHDNRVVYDYYKMLEYLVRYEDMTYEDASDFISYDTMRALSYMPGNTPVIIFPFDD